MIASLCGVALVARAQETPPPGMLASIDVTQRLEYSDNPDLLVNGSPELYARTLLDFNFQSETAIQNFALSFGTDVEEGRDNQSGIDLTNGRAELGYDRATQNASVGLSFSYREADSNAALAEDEFDIDGNVLEQDQGSRETYAFALSGAVGMQAPIGASFELGFTERTYSGTSDPDLTDQSTLSSSGQIDFRITPRITARLTGKYIDFDAQGNGTDRETTGFGAGAALVVTSTLTADVGISYDSIERSGDETGTNDGLSLDAGLTRALKNGTIGATLGSEVSSNSDGRRSYFSIDRDMAVSRRADLSFSFGATQSQNSSVDPLFNIDYAYALPTSQISFGVSQRVNSDSDNREQLNTTVKAGYQHEINAISSLGADLTFFDRNQLGSGADDLKRINISLSYNHALTRDWGLVGGVSHVLSTRDSAPDRTSNTVFIGLTRNFAWVP